MSSETGKPSGEPANLPFVRPVVRQIIEGLFREQAQWKSGELVGRVVRSHRDRGGAVVPNPNFTIIRVLRDLKDDGLVISSGHGWRHGWWRWTGAPPDGPIAAERQATHTVPSIDEEINEIEPVIRPEKEVGDGHQCVYLYFNPNDRRLAELEGRDVRECKIGRTSSRDAIQRILGQGIRTSLSRLPTVGLVFRTQDSSALENALHASLRLVGAEVPESPGNERFINSPERVEAWYESFQDALATIRTSSAKPA